LDAATSAGSEDRDPRREEEEGEGCIALSSPWYSDPDHTRQKYVIRMRVLIIEVNTKKEIKDTVTKKNMAQTNFSEIPYLLTFLLGQSLDFWSKRRESSREDDLQYSR
jgi:hypothetical protein